MKNQALHLILCTFLIFAAATNKAMAANYVWQGPYATTSVSSTGTFNTPGNWKVLGVTATVAPGAADDLVIALDIPAVTTTTYTFLSASMFAKSLTLTCNTNFGSVGASSTLFLATAGFKLDVIGNIDFTTGTGTKYGSVQFSITAPSGNAGITCASFTSAPSRLGASGFTISGSSSSSKGYFICNGDFTGTFNTNAAGNGGLGVVVNSNGYFNCLGKLTIDIPASVGLQSGIIFGAYGGGVIDLRDSVKINSLAGNSEVTLDNASSSFICRGYAKFQKFKFTGSLPATFSGVNTFQGNVDFGANTTTVDNPRFTFSGVTQVATLAANMVVKDVSILTPNLTFAGAGILTLGGTNSISNTLAINTGVTLDLGTRADLSVSSTSTTKVLNLQGTAKILAGGTNNFSGGLFNLYIGPQQHSRI